MPGTSDSDSRCFICRKQPTDSREHLPAKAAGNLGAVEVFYLDSSSSPDSAAEYRTRVFDDGFWVRRFCETCNNLLGRRYVPAYKELIKATEGASGIRDAGGRLFISLPAAYPSRILKQMFAMFLAALPKLPDPAWKPLQDFVRLRDSVLPPSAPEVYLYHNSSSYGRIVPSCGFIEFTSHETLHVSEISWPPLGIVFSFQESERFQRMEKVSAWGGLAFSERRALRLALPSLEVSTPFPLVYGDRDSAERERNERGHAYLVQVPDRPGGEIDVAAQLRRLR
jgi:hypothetical protein